MSARQCVGSRSTTPDGARFCPGADDRLNWRGSGEAVVEKHMDPIRGDLSTEGARVVLRSDTGNVPLPAADIYSLATHGRSEHAELRRPAVESMPGIVFMSRPLIVFIWARNAAGEGLKIDPAVTLRGQPEVLGELVDDHMVSGDVWYPLEAESSRGCKRMA